MTYLTLMLVVISAITSVSALPSLPELVPMHWNIEGVVDNWMPKGQAVLFFPALMAGMWLLFQILPLFDPHKKKYAQFRREWEIMQSGLLGFFLFVQIMAFRSAATGASIFPSFFVGLGTLFVLLGNYLSKIRQNYFIGIKVPWMLSSEDNWNKTHRVGSWCFVVAGLITIVEGFVQWFAPYIMFGSILLATVIPIVYSFYLFKSKSVSV